ncbi:hypothetical protein [Flavobacterium algicola]|uniref:hypothetical protein n=1 Tax=Flavobacterium algicola TaxID=556529 RepID=UPI001EFC4D39|nr:hypothetical protein [Flavobacterium algicola]MCG9793533.1 hypothetical protein [Flavobacterium algicola]
MNITYYLVGVLTGASLSTFFVGKELYKYYIKYKVQRKQMDRLIKLNDKIVKANEEKRMSSRDIN